MASQPQRNIKARYHTRYLGKQSVTYNQCKMIKPEGAEHPQLEVEKVTEDKDCWMISFPQGHSIRVTDRRELERMGYHLKPRMVDMNTGDVVDMGGDPYDFASNYDEVIVMDDEDLTLAKAKTKAATT